MPQVRQVRVSYEQYEELEWGVRYHPTPSVREKCAAVLKVIAGIPAHQVAVGGYGLRRRDPDTVYSWIERAEAAGIAGLEVAEGRGRKPAFFPSAP
jgi:hypothetical protein